MKRRKASEYVSLICYDYGMGITAIILTKNEEQNITACLKQLSWCDEILVIDDHSIDQTVKLAQKLKVKILTHNLNNDFAAQRNWALNQAQNEWVLFVDADERISGQLKQEIIATVNHPLNQSQGYLLSRTDFMWGKKLQYGEAGKIKLLRLAKKTNSRWQGSVHETWQIKGKIDSLNNPLEHYPHPTIDEFLRKINFYTDLRAQELYSSKTKVSWYAIVLFPLAKFYQNYFFKLGILDGLPGLIIAILMSFHSFLVRGKLWTLWDKQKTAVN